ncbi:hypothetical protein [Pontibacter arcticus]|uniref:Uncharacterized protein n=1 Tax=Pontibacter arcticus TaxID=2080288 RepID=A0A364RAX4_9BACT|nr:hypothetical protein [Pontibacter arcticus]RAU81374.1 hypothetical protein DP923_16200 [Pontibacter arcticus]RAU81439.1 hypothetical protein DP923_16545 [Pontibacter arcticus]
MKKCIDHPTMAGGKICQVIEPDGMRFEIYLGGKLIGSFWMTSEWDDYPVDEVSSIIRKEKIDRLLKFFDEESGTSEI